VVKFLVACHHTISTLQLGDPENREALVLWAHCLLKRASVKHRKLVAAIPKEIQPKAVVAQWQFDLAQIQSQL
jgi:hypothetical protein